MRKAEQSAVSRRALLDAARSLFGHHGFDATSVDDVAAAASLTKGSLYHQFEDKAALFEAVFIEVEEQVVQRLQEAVHGLDDPIEIIHRGLAAFLDVCLDPQVRSIALIQGPVVLGCERWRELEGNYGLGLAQAALAAANQAGRLRDQNLDIAAHILFGAAIEAALTIATAPDKEQARNDATSILESIVNALAE